MPVIRPARLVASLSVFAVAAVLTPAASAQTDASKPTSRAEVKEETKAAAKAGQLLPPGEAGVKGAAAPKSTKTRAERKAETMQARKEGKLLPSGEATYKASVSQPDATKGSTKTRAERKAETQKAAKEGQLLRPGEVADPSKK